MNQSFTESKALFQLGFPIILSQLAQMSMGVIDTIMAGRVSAEALAAIAVGTSIVNPIIVFVMGIFLAFNPIVAQLNGRGHFDQIGRVFQHSFIVAIVFSIPCVWALWHMEPLLDLLDIQERLITTVLGYLGACSYGILPLFLFYGLRFCNEGLFATKTIMVVTAAAIPFNITFNYWFIWGGLGVPPLGAVGVGYATAVVWLVMALGLGSYTFFTKRYRHLSIFNRWHAINPKQMREIFTLGLPMGIGVGMEVAMFAFIGLMIGSYAIHIVAAHQVAINVTSLTYMIPLGLSMAITARVGFYRGRNDYAASKRAGNVGITIAAAIAILSAILIFAFAETIVRIYSKRRFGDRHCSVLAVIRGYISNVRRSTSFCNGCITGYERYSNPHVDQHGFLLAYRFPCWLLPG